MQVNIARLERDERDYPAISPRRPCCQVPAKPASVAVQSGEVDAKSYEVGRYSGLFWRLRAGR
jgi:hypothetical protein